MDWNPASLTQATHHQFPGNLATKSHHHGSSGAPLKSALSVGGASSRAGVVLGNTSSELKEDADDRRPSTPRNVSPAVLVPPEFGDDSLIDENHDDLLVFGYGCKIFRDDERAQWIEEQKHLIPWMGNPDLLIDRYDCRGALMDVSRYEPGSGYDNLQEASEDGSEDLNSSYEQEQMLEQELDAERYKELNENVDYDEGAYDKAADYKRLQTAMNGMLSESHGGGTIDNTRNYAAFQYNYDAQSHDICIGPEPKRVLEEDAPYIKPVGLYIPEEIILPSTMKVHAIIEKTAKFIASQGNQMEIILKTKQSSNPLFDFLTHGGNLNPYYKFLVHAIRSGIYRPPSEQEDASSNKGANQSLSSEYSGSEEDSEHHTYLHPSLFRASNSSTGSTLSSIDYPTVTTSATSSASSSRHNAYSMLVSKIKGTDSPDSLPQQQQLATSTLTSGYGSEYPSSQLQNNSNQLVSVYGYNISSQQTPVQTPQKKLPSTPDQLIIEKMASYVIKNGANFEVLAKNKSDPRFGFLNPTHEFHWYYLNCKERYKAECTAVVASSEFVNYTSSTNSGSSSNSLLNNNLNSTPVKIGTSTVVNVTSPTIKKSAVAAELAELKRKNSGVVAKKDTAKDNKYLSLNAGAENVFSQASLVQSKEKDKPVIRFASSLSLNVSPSTSSVTASVPEECVPARNLVSSIKLPCLSQQSTTKEQRQHRPSTEEQKPVANAVVITASTSVVEDDEEEEEGEIRDTNDSDSDIYLLDDGGGNSTPASEDDEEKVRRRLERKRKAVLFLQKLKMSKGNTTSGSTNLSSTAMTSAKSSSNLKASSSDKSATKAKTARTGSSLGDLLVSRRLQSSLDKSLDAQQDKVVPPEITISDSEDNGRVTGRLGESCDVVANAHHSDSSKSSSSRHSSRGRSKNHTTSSSSRNSKKRRKRKKSRSYSSSPSRSASSSASSYDSNSRSAYSKKKSSKKKRKRKKKKYDKSSSRSSHKSKRRIH